MKPAWILSAAAALVVGLGLTVAFVGEKPATSPASPVVAAPDLPASQAVASAPLRVVYPRGKQFTYRWSHQASTEARIEDSQPVRGAVDFDGELVLRGYGSALPLGEGKGEGRGGHSDLPGGGLVGVSFTHLARHQLSALGQDVLADDDAAQRLFDGREAFAEIIPSGAVRSVRFHREDPTLFKNVVLSALLPLAMSLRDGSPEWTVSERTAVGVASTRYARAGASSVNRSRFQYASIRGLESCDGCGQRLISDEAIVLDPGGWLSSLNGVEDLQVSKANGASALAATLRVSLRLSEVTSFEPATIDLSALEAAQLGDAVEDPGLEDRMLAARVRGLTAAEMLRTLASVSAPGAQPPPNFVARASALLMQHPEYCAKLVTLFKVEDTTSRTKALVMDVLASAATPQAQKAMREALASRAATNDSSYSMLLQRFSFVPRPDGETADFIAERYRRARSRGNRDVEFASAHTLGAIAGGLTRTDPDLGRRYDAQLRDDLAGASSIQEKKELLAALGNAHSDEDIEVSRRYASSNEPELRAEAARALRNATISEARQTLISLVADAEPSVQVASLSALSGRPFSADEAAQFSSLVLSGGTPINLDNDLLSFLGAKAASGNDVRAMLEYISQRNTDVRVRARANLILEQLAMQAAR